MSVSSIAQRRTVVGESHWQEREMHETHMFKEQEGTARNCVNVEEVKAFGASYFGGWKVFIHI